MTRFTRDDTLEVVRLASFPRSRNTWTRYLLETATGIFTSSGRPSYTNYLRHPHEDWRLDEKQIWRGAKLGQLGELGELGFIGEGGMWTQTIVMKTHVMPQPWNKTEADGTSQVLAAFADNSTRRAVLIIRDPFKSFISLKKYGQTQSVLSGTANLTELFRGEKWAEFVMYYAQFWYDLNRRWLEATNATHVVTYERLTRDTMTELQAMLEFLEIEPDPRRLECVRRHMEGRAHNRQHTDVPDEATYPLWLRAEVWSRIHQLNSHLRDRGYRPLPLEHYSFAEQFQDIGLDQYFFDQPYMTQST